MLLLFFLFAISYSSVIPRMTGFNYNTVDDHKISGTISTDGSPFGLLELVGSVTLIVNPADQRWSLQIVQTFPTSPPLTIHEFIWVLPNNTYISGAFYNPDCLEVPGYNWTVFVEEFKFMFAQPDSNSGHSEYFGHIRDFFACGRASSQLFKLKNNLFEQMSGAYNLILFPSSFCYNSRSILEFDRNTVSTGPFDNDFILPSQCWPQNNPSSYCEYNTVC